jgi:hypothetical protein
VEIEAKFKVSAADLDWLAALNALGPYTLRTMAAEHQRKLITTVLMVGWRRLAMGCAFARSVIARSLPLKGQLASMKTVFIIGQSLNFPAMIPILCIGRLGRLVIWLRPCC